MSQHPTIIIQSIRNNFWIRLKIRIRGNETPNYYTTYIFEAVSNNMLYYITSHYREIKSPILITVLTYPVSIISPLQ